MTLLMKSIIPTHFVYLLSLLSLQQIARLKSVLLIITQLKSYD